MIRSILIYVVFLPNLHLAPVVFREIVCVQWMISKQSVTEWAQFVCRGLQRIECRSAANVDYPDLSDPPACFLGILFLLIKVVLLFVLLVLILVHALLLLLVLILILVHVLFLHLVLLFLLVPVLLLVLLLFLLIWIYLASFSNVWAALRPASIRSCPQSRFTHHAMLYSILMSCPSGFHFGSSSTSGLVWSA